MIALRTDIDALPIPENNDHLDYKSTTNFAHMCGHDGHMMTLMAAAEVFCKNRDKIPLDQTVRLLCQPAEEGPGGALPMVKEGCLEGVDEVYGYHNVPNFAEGDIRVCSGAIMAETTVVRINVHGKGGHGSTPHCFNDVITCATNIHANLHTIKSRCINAKEHFVFTITHLTSGFTYNVFPDDAFMQGTIRSYTKELTNIENKIRHIVESTAVTFGCTANVEFDHLYPAVINHPKETEHVKRLASKYFGEEKVSDSELPLTASEDFSFFLEQKPGCFFMLGTMIPGGPKMNLHVSNYDYND